MDRPQHHGEPECGETSEVEHGRPLHHTIRPDQAYPPVLCSTHAVRSCYPGNCSSVNPLTEGGGMVLQQVTVAADPIRSEKGGALLASDRKKIYSPIKSFSPTENGESDLGVGILSG